MIEHASDFFGGIELTAVSIHLENDRSRARVLRRLFRAPKEQKQRWGYLAS